MKKIWLIILLSAITTLLFKDPSLAIAAMIKGSHDAVNLSMSLVALYAFWLGFFAILEKTGIAAKLARLLTPLVRFLFPSAGAETGKYITMNISANLLGLGNAATPMAISAVNSMKSDENGRASINMIMLMVISSTSLQILPTTVIGLRASHGSSNPTDFLIPCIAATVTSTILGITLVKLYALIRKRKKQRGQKESRKPLTLATAIIPPVAAVTQPPRPQPNSHRTTVPDRPQPNLHRATVPDRPQPNSHRTTVPDRPQPNSHRATAPQTITMRQSAAAEQKK